MEVSKIVSVLDDRDNNGVFTAIIFTDRSSMKTLAKTLEEAAPDAGMNFEGWSEINAYAPGLAVGDGMAFYAFDFGFDDYSEARKSDIGIDDVVELIENYF